MKRMKVVALVAAAVVTAGVLCGCAPGLGRIGQIFGSAAREARAEARAEMHEVRDEVHGEISEAFSQARTQIEEDWQERFPEDYYSMTSSIYDPEEAPVNDMAEYEPYGLTFEEANGQNWFNEKPLAGFYDKRPNAGINMLTSSAYADIGAYVVVERDADGKIVRLYETDKESFMRLSGIDAIGNLEQGAAEMGYSVYREDVRVKGLDAAAFLKLENELRMKYKDKNAAVECRDYVFYFSGADLYPLSSFCYSDKNVCGARAYVDYHSADGLDLNAFDRDKTDDIIMQVLNESYGSKTALKEAIREAISQAYGVSEDDLLIHIEAVL